MIQHPDLTVTDWLALTSPIIALVGAAIGALGAYFAGRRQANAAIKAAERQNEANIDLARANIEASVVAASRQRWIDELRSQLAAFVASLYRLETIGTAQTSAGQEGWVAELAVATEIETRVTLMLNPHENEHMSLMVVIWAAMDDLRSGAADLDHLNDTRMEITKRAQGVLKTEWERVKSVAVLAATPSRAVSSSTVVKPE